MRLNVHTADDNESTNCNTIDIEYIQEIILTQEFVLIVRIQIHKRNSLKTPISTNDNIFSKTTKASIANKRHQLFPRELFGLKST